MTTAHYPTGPAITSLFAYHREIKPTLAERQRAVYDELKKNPNGNMTNNEIAASLHAPINTITPRVFELRKMGRVVEDRKRPCRITGRLCSAWRVA